jgi:Ser/Thr protein kinase RdoA (MazF antagonist)
VAADPNVRWWKQATYNALLLADGVDATLVVRVRVYGDDALERSVEREHAILARVPPGVGPRALFADASCTRVPYPYRIETRSEGHHPRAFDDDLVIRLAALFARLHGRIEDRSGGDPAGTARALRSLLDVDAGDDRALASLLRAGGAALRRYAERFGASSAATIHGDPHLDNVLDTAGGCVLLDWEQAARDDPALDLAALCWMSALMGITSEPLSEAHRRLFFLHYAGTTGDRTAEERTRLLEPLVVALQAGGLRSKLLRRAELPPHLAGPAALAEMQAGIARGIYLARACGFVR